MFSKWTPIVLSVIAVGIWTLARAEESSSDDSAPTSTPERVQIFSIGGKSMATHPPVIKVLPGERISFRADVLQFGLACPHPEGCPEGREADEFSWSADDRPGNECNAGGFQACPSLTNFEPKGTEMLFHIPVGMGPNITIQVSHQGIDSKDTIVLHNGQYPDYARGSNYAPPPAGYYDDGRYDTHLYPTFAPSGVNEPYWGPYPYYQYAYARPYNYWWGPYPYYYSAWGGWGGPVWTVGIGWGYGPAWGWGYPYRGWGYYPGWWRPGYAVPYGPRIWQAGVGAPRIVERVNRLPTRPMGYGGSAPMGNGFGRWRRRGH